MQRLVFSSLRSAFPQPEDVPRLAGNSCQDVFAFLIATVEYQKKKGVYENVIYTPFIELETQQAVISQLNTRNLTCSIHRRGSGLDWYLSPGSSSSPDDDSASSNSRSSAPSDIDPELKRMKYDDLVQICALVGPIVGSIYGAFNGDIIHGFIVGFAVGMLPLLPMLLLIPFMLIWEKFFENR